jgi:hypothetical protein
MKFFAMLLNGAAAGVNGYTAAVHYPDSIGYLFIAMAGCCAAGAIMLAGMCVLEPFRPTVP